MFNALGGVVRHKVFFAGKTICRFALAVPLVALGFASCKSESYSSSAIVAAGLRAHADQDAPFGVTGKLRRLEDGNWKMSLYLDGVRADDIGERSLLHDPFPPALLEEDGKCVVSWEVPAERFRSRKSFCVSLHLNGQNRDALIEVKHPPISTKSFDSAYAWDATEMALEVLRYLSWAGRQPR